jgi:hypothetical protein
MMDVHIGCLEPGGDTNTKIIKSLPDLDIQIIKLNKFKFDKTIYTMNNIIKFASN